MLFGKALMTSATRRAPAGLALGLTLVLGACSGPGAGFSDSSWSPLGGPWLPGAGARDPAISDGLTAQRVRGAEPEFTPLLAETGNVWPPQEAPRPTLLGSPEEAFRNVPDYRPSFVPGAAPARSPVATPGLPGADRPGGLGSGLPPAEPPVARARPPGVTPPPPPARGSEGQVLIDPEGRPAVSTGQAGRVRGFTQPGVGGGAVVRDGNVETWIGPDGQARTRVVPP